MRTQFLLLATVASMALTAAANPVPQDGGEQNNGQYTAWTETSTSTTVEATSTTTTSEQVPTWTESGSVSVTETGMSL
ncbi:hypothetical protein BCR44DRAFT_37131 [Catenaria anguillulae PL171]|uniref:Uncharacterized protein n=1 Tax=Catenaria anguillulae PL171 TaxID=765915 RepID=A0A1Y2HBZ7_9FUNG|nr:hypothetical protein BCR44DRAFT_37131 [Catenaria anguillulae PL171]